MGRNQFWLFMIAGVAFGLCMEAIKHVDLTSSKGMLDSRELIAAEPVDSNHFHDQKRKQAAFPKRRGLQQSGEIKARVAGLAPEWSANTEAQSDNVGTTQPKGHQKPKTEAELKKEKEAAEKKKKEDAKKKKKKKKTVPGESETKDAQDSTEDDKNDSTGDGSTDVMNDVGPGAVYAGAPLIDPTGIPQTLEEWEAYVLKDPDFKKTSLLIKYYQTSLVKADTFYTVVEQMLADSRQDMRALGVMALGQTLSARSFTLLTSVLDEEKGNSPLKAQVKIYMKHYTQLQNLKYLANAMTQESEPRASYEALRLFRIAADYHLKQLATQGENNSNGTGSGSGSGPRQPAASSITRYFNPFVSILTNLTQTSHDASFRQEVSQALDNLQSLLAQRPA